MKILIADDELVSLRMLERTLERDGYEVVAVEDGRTAAERLCDPHGPRLALLDWMMPQLDGPAVCRAVRRKRSQRHVYVVLLTSKSSKEDIVEGLESGADDYLIKPFDPGELKARLRTGLRILELEDHLLEAREDMRYKATHDSLTSLLNRGTILELLSGEMNRIHRRKSPIAIVLGDIDHFKLVNDTHGHVAGDEVLRETGRRLLASVRSYDFIGRYGGEEFLAVLTNCGMDAAMKRAEDIRKAIGGSPFLTSQNPVSVTMSLGVFAGDTADYRSLEEILCEVDSALYAAKSAGRNCCRLAVPSNPR